MKRVLILLAAIIAAVCAIYAEYNGALIEFKEKSHDFGTIHEKKGKVTAEFEFTNVGAKPLVITSAYATCGCTTPKYPQEPIAPGATGKIIVQYNPANRLGEFFSTVTINTNDKKNKKVKLKLTGTVVP